MNPLAPRRVRTALLAALLILPSCSSSNAPKPKAEQSTSAAYQSGVPGGTAVETTTVTARIVAVFPSSRELTLQLPDGTNETVKCGPEVINFDQLQKDDTVKVALTQEIAVAMRTESDPPDTTGDGIISLAPKGGTPGGVMAATTQVTATVTAIDVGHHTATLQFPNGQTRTIPVRHDVDLTKRKVGEKVVIRKTSALALRVEKPQPK